MRGCGMESPFVGPWPSFPRSAWERTSSPLRGACGFRYPHCTGSLLSPASPVATRFRVGLPRNSPPDSNSPMRHGLTSRPILSEPERQRGSFASLALGLGQTSTPAPWLVFSDDWGRHPTSCQHLVRHLLPD